MRRADERTMFAVAVLVLVTGSPWRDAGKVFLGVARHRASALHSLDSQRRLLQ